MLGAHVLFGHGKVGICSAELTPNLPVQTPARRQRRMREHSGADIPFDAVPTDVSNDWSFHASHASSARMCRLLPLLILPSRHRQTGRGSGLKITTPCAGWRWSRHCAIAHASGRMCTASFSDCPYTPTPLPPHPAYFTKLIHFNRRPETDQ